MYVDLLAVMFISLRHLHFVPIQKKKICVVLVCSRTRYVGILFALPIHLRILLFRFFSISHSVTTYIVSLQDKESGRMLGMLVHLGKQHGVR